MLNIFKYYITKLNLTQQISEITEIATDIKSHGGRAYLVGGYVRDLVLGYPSKDIDCEVFNLDYGTLTAILAKYGKVDTVGKSFGVIKLTAPNGQDFDFSLPRRDSKTGQGHTGFTVFTDSNLSVKEAAERRDFTINAISLCPITLEYFDPFNGLEDIADRVLRHTSERFTEDPLRVLRGMQFLARFNFKLARPTAEICFGVSDTFDELPKERIWGEFQKLFLKGQTPSFGLIYLKVTGWLKNFPEVEALLGCQQNATWHPEGDVFKHTCHVLDEAAKICSRQGIVGEDREVIMAAALCHDFGKPATTTSDLRAPGHDIAGVQPAVNFLARIGFPIKNVAKVAFLVAHHMVHCSLEGTPSLKMVRRLKLKCQDMGLSLEMLGHVIEADHSGRPPLAKGMPMGFQTILKVAKALPERIEPLVLGRHLLALEWEAGAKMGVELKRLFEMQLEGVFNTLEDGLKLVNER